MMKIYMRIASVDMNGFTGREHHPHPGMLGCFVRITNMDTVPCTDSDETKDDGPFMVFHGIVVDDHGNDMTEGGGEVELVEFEIETLDGIPVLYGRDLAAGRSTKL